ncbi:MAG: hypothetical protein IPI35_35395 [Deltaproteobacteria bacterium]|nr:hypothetical protein [Deltaproteobacteria bacterium]
MAANAYHRVTGDAEVAKFGLEVARWMVETYEYTGEDSPGRTTSAAITSSR